MQNLVFFTIKIIDKGRGHHQGGRSCVLEYWWYGHLCDSWEIDCIAAQQEITPWRHQPFVILDPILIVFLTTTLPKKQWIFPLCLTPPKDLHPPTRLLFTDPGGSHPGTSGSAHPCPKFYHSHTKGQKIFQACGPRNHPPTQAPSTRHFGPKSEKLCLGTQAPAKKKPAPYPVRTIQKWGGGSGTPRPGRWSRKADCKQIPLFTLFKLGKLLEW